MSKKKQIKRKNVIIISALCSLIAIFIIGYGIGLILGDGPKKSQANNSIVDLSKKGTEQSSEENDSLNKEETESNEDNKDLDKEDAQSNENDKDLDKQNNASDEDAKEENEVDKNTKQESDNKKSEVDDAKSGQDQSNKDIDASKLTTKEIWDIYNEGNRLYKQGNYAKALPKLEMSYKIKPDSSLMPWLTYQLANSYKELNDNANALVYFKKVIKNYPNSEFVSSAERMIKEIEK